jgi:uncharacterized membrane protein (DUF485 family)
MLDSSGNEIESQNKSFAVGYTFLWSFVYGFFILVLIGVMSILVGGVTTKSATIGGLLGVIVFTSIFILRLWLIYGKAFDYGYEDGLKDCQNSLIQQPTTTGIPIVTPNNTQLATPNNIQLDTPVYM